ncbi:MAG TPA: EBSC protein [Dysgonomonas sp.]|nr:EBSC protein [Dysgonomonas sp.]
MSIEKVRDYFQKWDIADRIQEFEMSSATVELAAKAVGCEPARIAKSLAFKINDAYIIIVTAGDTKIDNQKYKSRFHTKSKMISPDEAEQYIGHAVGGVCPFAVNEGITIYLDESLKRFETVFPACGSINSAIELSIPELEVYSGYEEWINVCKITSG